MRARSLSMILMPAMAAAASASEPAPVVRTNAGPVRGLVADGVRQWLGIPFAAPPTGPDRWRAPQPVARWSAVREARAYGHDCAQQPFPSDAAPLGTAPSEDCLVLNVWAPRSPRARLPVIVWFYGGGFVNGGSSPATYAGARLARQGAVVVSFNYRVGRFGTFVHPALEGPASARASGNYGYMDQLAALRWVQANVAAFGGDPRNVTIVGESAGGMSVHTLITSPMSDGLFARAVVMSGGDGESGAATRDAAQAASLAFAAGQGIAADAPDAAARLRALTTDQVVDGLTMRALFPGSGTPRTFASPYPDGTIALPVAATYRRGTFRHVPVMIGATSNDIGGPDGMMIRGARTLAGLIADAGVPTYYYRFSYVAQAAPGGSGGGAGHATDVPFFFATQRVKYGAATTARDDAMGRLISRYLLNFATTGDPNGDGLPAWRRYDRNVAPMMDFTASGTAVAGSEAAR
ncbi:carboxylesterase/lipase family protein [Sphingomonas sp. CV7422]|uniref:carboxylesterase/lipase family protein n=1 Tax=Sphingomonas sp. CV7422 TaxID=3018036 RepID=UPI0022FE11E9|nr:carboxylesterase family protein [Sphingomonas sp. CV7422]